ncbi:hypothetical protein HBB16_08685 [Pseudonocardia sp. MCCB 268]|nr:hypothetical protein [Pseudonocardia cytotoxica]
MGAGLGRLGPGRPVGDHRRSRAATRYGVHTAVEFASALARCGVTVFLARRSASTRLPTAARSPSAPRTVAVLALRADRAYPASHTGLIERSRDRLVLTEYPPGTLPGRLRFLVRNRLSRRWARMLVVEAGARSGTRRTAGTRPHSAGCDGGTGTGHVGLSRSGATSRAFAAGRARGRPEDVLEIVGRLGLTPPCRRGEHPPTGSPARPGRARRTTGPRRLAPVPDRRGSQDPDAVRAALTELETRGLAEFTRAFWQRPALSGP